MSKSEIQTKIKIYSPSAEQEYRNIEGKGLEQARRVERER